MSVINNRLNEAMTARGMTASELSQKSGLSKSTISRYLSNERSPKSEAITKMAQALDVSASWLLGYDVPMSKENQINEHIVLIEKLSPDNKDRLKSYIDFLLSTQRGDQDAEPKI